MRVGVQEKMFAVTWSPRRLLGQDFSQIRKQSYEEMSLLGQELSQTRIQWYGEKSRMIRF